MVVTGFVLAQLYNPLPKQAYQSLEQIQAIGWASYLRALHHWFAQGVLLALIFHVGRVFITGAYKHPRQVTWWIGVALLGTMMMGSYFSGTVLKWDEEGATALHHYEEVLAMLGPVGAVMTEWLPGSSPMNLRIYVSHITILPVWVVLLLAAHFYLIHVLNLAPTPGGKWADAPMIPPQEIKGRFLDHARTILLASIFYYGSLALIAFFIRAPLGPPPSGGHAAVKPPWPFLWMDLFENIWGIGAILFLSLALFGFLAVVPLLDRGPSRRLGARKGILALGGFVGLSLFFLTLYGWMTPPQIHGEHSEGAADHNEDHHNDEEHSHDSSPSDSLSSGSTEETKDGNDHPHPEGSDHHD